MQGLEQDSDGRLIYRPDGEVLRSFIADNSHVSIIQGPLGSGTSSGCCMRLYRHAIEMPKSMRTGFRESKWIIARNTFPDLKETTVPTWLHWFPEEDFGRFYWDRPYRHVMRHGDCRTEVIFLALDAEDDIRKLLSLEVTGFWFNELEYVDKQLFDEAESRTGRFPAYSDVGQHFWDGVIGDMNAPPEDHWVPAMRGDVDLPDWMTEEQKRAYLKPRNWSFFVQPPGMLEIKNADGQVIGYEENPKAENQKHLKPGYYAEKIEGKPKAWIDRKILNKIGVIRAGKAVWPNFSREVHVAKERLRATAGVPLHIGIDWGRTPAAIFGQVVNGRIRILHELLAEDMGAGQFALLVKKEIQNYFPDHWDDAKFWADPAGADPGQDGEISPFDRFRAQKMFVRKPPGGTSEETRIEAVDDELRRMVDGYPAFLLSPNCVTLKTAMAGAYHYRKLKTNAERYDDHPEKDKYSHPADALQYLMLGMGCGRPDSKNKGEGKPQNVRRRYRRGDGRRRAA